jgi:hypothetical protein
MELAVAITATKQKSTRRSAQGVVTFPNPAQVLTGAENGVTGIDETQK